MYAGIVLKLSNCFYSFSFSSMIMGEFLGKRMRMLGPGAVVGMLPSKF